MKVIKDLKDFFKRGEKIAARKVKRESIMTEINIDKKLVKADRSQLVISFKKIQLFIIILIILYSYSDYIYAQNSSTYDVIYLKNEKVITGKIIDINYWDNGKLKDVVIISDEGKKLYYISHQIEKIVEDVQKNKEMVSSGLEETIIDSYIDVVYLKNGSVLKGIIIEQKIGEYIKLEMYDGSVFVFENSKIDKIQKEKTSYLSKQVSNKYRESKKDNSYYIERKNPGVALILSLVVFPGIGQFYNGEVGKGAIHLLAGALSLGIMMDGMQEVTTYNYWYGYNTEMKSESKAGLGALLYLATWIVSSVDAYSSAKKINQTLAFKENHGLGISFSSNRVNLSYRF